MFLVQLKQKQVVDYCVVVNGIHRVAIDSSERYPLMLSEDVLRLSGGDDESNLVVYEVREVVSRDHFVNMRQKKHRNVIGFIE